MICKDSVLEWFQGLSSHNRIDLMCSLLNKCLPFELRLVGTCLENLGRHHFTQMKDFEVKANNSAELSEFLSQSIISDTRTRQKLALYVCLLHSLNTACSTLIYKFLNGIDINEVVSTATKCDEKVQILEELLTIYTVCFNHPAFSFEQRSNLCNTLALLRRDENRIEVKRLTEAANEDYVQSQLTDGVDNVRPISNSEIPPPNAPPGLGYPPGLGAASNFFHIPVSMYPPYPTQQLPHVVWQLVNYPHMPPENLPPPFAASPRVSRHSSPTQSASPSRTGSPVRKPFQPRLERTDSQPKTRHQYNDQSFINQSSAPIKKTLLERSDSSSKDSKMEDDLRCLNERVAELSTEDTLRSTALNLNGVVAPSVRVPPPPSRQKLICPPIESDLQTGVRTIEESPVVGAPITSAVCRTAVLPPGPRYSQHPVCKNNVGGLEDNSRHCSSSSGSDASSASHSPPITPANITQNWDKGYGRDITDTEDPLTGLMQSKVERPRPGGGRGRGRFGAPGVQTLPRERGALPAGTRREGPRSAPPTPHEDKKTYLMPPPCSDMPPTSVTTSVVSPTSILSASTVSKPPCHDMVASGVPYATNFLPGPFTGPPIFSQYPPTFVRPPYSYPNGEVMYSYQAAAQPFLPSRMVTYSSSVQPPKIACYNCSSQNHHPTDCKEPTMEEYSSKDDNMSSVESAAMSGSEVSEKGPVDFGVKAVSLKSQGDSNRLLQTSGPIRSIPSTSITRPPSSFPTQHPSISHRPGLARVTTCSGSGGKSVTSMALPPVHSTTYLVPRGGAQPSGLGPRAPCQGRPASGNLQPVSTVQGLVRTPSPIASQPAGPGWGSNPPINNVRAVSPGSGPPRTTSTRTTVAVTSGKPLGQNRVAAETPRPLVLHPRPLTLTPTTQLHIATDKTMKVPVGSVAQVLPIRPQFGAATSFVTQNPSTTILQRTDGVALQSVPQTATVLTAPVRLAPSHPPLLTTQRVAVSASSSRVAVQQHLNVSTNISSPRAPAQGVQGARAPGSGTGPPGLPKIAVSSVATSAVLATTGRLTYPSAQVVAAPPPATRIPTPGNTVLSSTKHMAPGSAPLVVTTASRMPMPNHQIGKPSRFGPVRTPGPVSNQPLLTTTLPPGGLVMHPQLLVSTGKPPGLTANHVTTARPPPPNSAPGPKVIAPPHAPIQISTSPVTSSKSVPTPLPATSTQLTPVIPKQPDVYKLTPTSSMPNRSVAVVATQSVSQSSAPVVSSAESVYIPTTHRNITSTGIICSQPPLSERTTGASTLTTYTLPSGASYFYEAPSGYHLATDAPLVARPLSTDAPLVPRELSTEGPLIARPYTPGLITTAQSMRFNPVMIVDPTPSLSAVTSSASLTSDTATLTATESNPTTASKATSSPRPSILRKRDSEVLGNSKAVKNLSGALSSGSASRSRTPSPPTPPVSLTLETNQTTNDHGPSSNGSTTISATSSPGPEDTVDPDRPPVEMSPRKKPRKQLLNDANDSIIDMEFISEEKMKKEKDVESVDGCGDSDGKVVIVKRPANVSLLQSYKHNWKARNNHFQRYTDVKPREDRRPSVTELSNQRQILQRVNGWKIYHLNSQFEELSDVESGVLDRLSTIFQAMGSEEGQDLQKDISRVNDLIMGNIQRSKVIRDQMDEAKSQMMKVFDHKVHVSEIVGRCASKRNFKKRDKY